MSGWCPISQPDWVQTFCASRDSINHFKSKIGFSQCFEDAVLLSGVHTIMGVLLLLYVLQPRQQSSRIFHHHTHLTLVVLSIAMATMFGISLLERIYVSLALFELLTYTVCTLTWSLASYAILRAFREQTFALTLDLRFIFLMAGAPIIIRLRTVFILFSAETYIFVASNILAAVIISVLWGISLFHWPERVPVYEQVPDGEDTLMAGKGTPNPYTYASWMSKMWYLWFNPLLSAGYQRQLVASDVFELEPGMFTAEVRMTFQNAWEKEQRLHGKDASVFRTVFQIYKWEFAVSMVWKTMYDASTFAQPLLLNEMLLWIQGAKSEDSNCPGYVLSSLMVLATFMMPVLENSYFYHVYRTGLKSRSSLTDAVQRKSLRIHPRARDAIGTGAIVNHMTIDAEATEYVFGSLNQIWSAPIRIAVCLVLLYNLLGYASLVGFASLFVVFPLMGVASMRYARFKKAAMEFSDMRIKAMSEIVNGIRIVKFYTWEESSLQRVFAIRVRELKEYLGLAYVGAINMTLFNLNPIILAVVTFSVRSVYGGLTANEAFTALALLNIIRFPLMMLPGAVSSVLEAQVSLTRLSKFLCAEEVSPVEMSVNAVKGSVKMHNASIELRTSTDDKVSKFEMRNISVDFKPGSLTCVIGKTGSGKSSLLAGMVGDVELAGGTLTVDGTVSYVAQQAWITNDTVEGNILFGSPLDRAKLSKVLAACQLGPDIEGWTGGLQQEIGERGLNLSGGQKQRVAIARATYADSDIVLLDDPLSALDARVGRLLFDECIEGALKGRTRVLVTNQLQFLDRADWVVLVADGTIADQGTYAALNATSAAFKDFTCCTLQAAEEPEEKVPSPSQEKAKIEKKGNGTDNGRLVNEEHREEGTTLTYSLLKRYAVAAGGVWVIAVTLILFSAGQVASVGSAWWLAEWSGQVFDLSQEQYVLVYGMFGVGQGIVDFVTAVFLANVGNTAAQVIHDGMLQNLVRLPMAFFDVNPSGRILNRVTKDQGGIDDGIMFQVSLTLKCVFLLIGTIVAIAGATPLFVVVALPVLFAFYWTQIYYRKSLREMKRLESITRSPIYSFFGETLTGVSLIRAFNKQSYITHRLSTLLDHNQKFVLAELAANRWLNMRLEGLGTIVVFAVSFFAVGSRKELGAEIVGFALSYAFTVTSTMSIIIMIFAEAEKSFTAVERVIEYANLPTEKVKGHEDGVDDAWPQKGGIQFVSVDMAYRTNTPSVLRSVSFDVKPGEKIGVVGRTGSGKSSLFLALYRMVELRGGKILIDGVDISVLDLEKLRSSLAIIPQDPVVFGGTIRTNLDPFGRHTDGELETALQRAHLDTVTLNEAVTENGGNYSVGQRQLLCLARALLVSSKILVLDEATASVDPHTDRMVQDTINTEFKGRTLLIIAHRIQTVLDADRIIVLDDGHLAEFGPPEVLAESGGIFRSFIDQYGPESAGILAQLKAKGQGTK